MNYEDPAKCNMIQTWSKMASMWTFKNSDKTIKRAQKRLKTTNPCFIIWHTFWKIVRWAPEGPAGTSDGPAGLKNNSKNVLNFNITHNLKVYDHSVLFFIDFLDTQNCAMFAPRELLATSLQSGQLYVVPMWTAQAKHKSNICHERIMAALNN